jgi:putative addiction module component (TIGR02574 family)
MSDPSRPIDFTHLSIAERILLAQELWDSVLAHPESIPVPPQHQAELKRRIETMDSGTIGQGEPWDVVRARLWKP